jgi:hypothetical protein
MVAGIAGQGARSWSLSFRSTTSVNVSNVTLTNALQCDMQMVKLGRLSFESIAVSHSRQVGIKVELVSQRATVENLLLYNNTGINVELLAISVMRSSHLFLFC